jgi:hypothetical protein
MGSSEMVVGIQFYKLEMPHRIALLQGLAQRLKEQIQGANADASQARTFWEIALENWKASAVMILFLTFWLILLMWTWSLTDKF